MIELKIDHNGIPNKNTVSLGNKYENKEEVIYFDLPSLFNNYNQYIIAVLNNPYAQKVTKILPIFNNQLIITSTLTSHSGAWYLYVMCRQKPINIEDEYINITAKSDEHVFISNGFIGLVQDNLIDSEQINNYPLDDNLQILYDDLLNLKEELEKIVVGAISWDQILNKPSEFPPLPHNHNNDYYTKKEVQFVVNEKIEDIAITKEDTITNEDIESLFRQKGWLLR